MKLQLLGAAFFAALFFSACSSSVNAPTPPQTADSALRSPSRMTASSGTSSGVSFHGYGTGQTSIIYDIAFDGAGTLWGSRSDVNELLRFGAHVINEPMPNGLKIVSNLQTGTDGNVYLIGYGSSKYYLVHVTDNGSRSLALISGFALNQEDGPPPAGTFAAGRDGYFYHAVCPTNDPQTAPHEIVIQRLNRAGAVVGHGSIESASGSCTPNFLVDDAKGDLWIESHEQGQGQSQLYKVNRQTFALEQSEPYTLNIQSEGPSALTLGPDGNLWTTSGNAVADCVGKINVATGSEQCFSIHNTNVAPTSITSGNDGNLWFTNGSATYPQPTELLGKVTVNGAVTLYQVPTYSELYGTIAAPPVHGTIFSPNSVFFVGSSHDIVQATY